MGAWRWLAVVVLGLLLGRGTGFACVGTECMEIWSTADGGGALTVYWDFAHKKVQTFGFCLQGTCSYSNTDTGFITTGDPPPDGYYPLADNTEVKIEIVAIDPAVSMKNVNSFNLTMPGQAAVLGTAPTLHIHPSWQISVPEGTPLGDYGLSYKLTTSSALYTESQVYAVTLTNLPTPTPNQPTATATPTATPTPSPSPPPCPGDCNGDRAVSVAELVRGVSIALGGGVPCAAFDLNGDGTVAISELVAAVDAALDGCPMLPTPTATPPATLDEIQTTIFSPRCAIPLCHDSATHVQDLNLEAGAAYAQLVNVAPETAAASAAGLLRVDPGHPENSFLVVKVAGKPPDGEGEQMPETGGPLTAAEVQLIRDWIAQGANP